MKRGIAASSIGRCDTSFVFHEPFTIKLKNTFRKY